MRTGFIGHGTRNLQVTVVVKLGKREENDSFGTAGQIGENKVVGKITTKTKPAVNLTSEQMFRQYINFQ